MNYRVIVGCCVAVLLSLSLAFGRGDDGKKCPAGSSASCCALGTKASLSTASKTDKDAVIVPVNDKGVAQASGKECAMKGVKDAANCTAAEKANCDMSKASMTKAGTKADCCAGKAKGAKASNSVKKAGAKIVEAKGTN
jgi:hypothetical protein